VPAGCRISQRQPRFGSAQPALRGYQRVATDWTNVYAKRAKHAPPSCRPMHDRPRFLFATCQIGAETALKREMARRWPALKLAYSRPGFLTFKLPEEHGLLADFDLESVFARCWGFCLGKVSGTDRSQMAHDLWQRYGRRPVRQIHAWQRDLHRPGERGYEPGITPAAREAHEAILAERPREQLPDVPPDAYRTPAKEGDFVLDCVVVEPNQWWVGYHRAGAVASRWPGGMMSLELPPHAVSRAWLKMEEGLRRSQLPISPGARCVELGSAPGGGAQALLDRGCHVLGIDPAAMHPRLLEHPHFVHIRRRVAQVRRREFRKVRWLMADLNVPPDYTLEVVEDIVTQSEVHIRGLLLTLKLPQWDLADQIPRYLSRVRSWGFNLAAARQLLYNRQEVCLAAWKRPFRRTFHKGRLGGDRPDRRK